jgi:hypothetical protein
VLSGKFLPHLLAPLVITNLQLKLPAIDGVILRDKTVVHLDASKVWYDASLLTVNDCEEAEAQLIWLTAGDAKETRSTAARAGSSLGDMSRATEHAR